MIPTGRLVALSAVPILVAIAAMAEPTAVFLMIALDAALALIAFGDVAMARGKVEARRAVPPVQAVGRPFDVVLTLINRGSRGLRLRVTDDAPGECEELPVTVRLPRNRQVDVTYQIRVNRRGEHQFGDVTIRWRSPLGLWERQKQLAEETTLRVYPNFRQLRHYGLQAREDDRRAPVRVRRRPGGENEFERLRPYVPGDPYRHIDWRATARRKSLITREFGQESNQNLIFLLDCGRMMTGRVGSGGESALTAFDHALNAALMMGQTALRHGDRVGLLAFDTDVRVWLKPKGGARSGSRMIRATYDLRPRHVEPDYAAAFRHLAHHVRRRSLVVLLTSVVDEVNGDLATSLVNTLRRRHLPMCVWIRDEGVTELLDAQAETVLNQYQRCAAAELTHWREKSLAALQKRGALVVDCAPDELTPRLLSRYLEIKARRLL